MSSKSAQERFPIHWLVWHNQYDELDKELTKSEVGLEEQDPRGRTPLHLAVALGYLESTRVLLRHGANAGAENKKYWSVTQEAVATGDPEMVQLCLQYRDFQRYTRRTEGVPGLLQRLKEAPDFYVEMKWEFTSWVPLVSRMCPSDTYKVWKSGSNVRIDTTLLGFDNMNWQRGKRSYVFKGEVDSATVMEIDHDHQQVYTEVMRVLPEPSDPAALKPSSESVAIRLTSPIATTYIDTDKIEFERNKSGIWGWRSDRSEEVNGHECKVFSASNVELITKTRTEHLTEQDKEKTRKMSKNPLESFLGIAEQQEKEQGATANGLSTLWKRAKSDPKETTTTSNNPTHLTPEEYFDPELTLEGRDIGRPIDQTSKTQKFKATMWLCERYPLSLPEQVVPIIDLMAASNAHFKKLKDFITLQLPAGFPVKIEIPLFHVLNARITFGNIFASDDSAPGVRCLGDGTEAGPMCCVVEDACFEPPASYLLMGDGRHERLRDEDDELLQFAIQQSLMEAGTENDQGYVEILGPEGEVTFWEALNKSRPQSFDAQAEEERQLQRALEESMRMQLPSSPSDGLEVSEPLPPRPISPCLSEGDDDQFMMALQLSKRQQEDDEQRRRQEEEELERIIQLSLTET